MDTAKNELRRRVNERMKPIKRQLVKDARTALSRMSEAEKRGPGAKRRISELIDEIEANRRIKRLEELTKDLQTLAGAAGEVKETLASLLVKKYSQGFDAGIMTATELLELSHFRAYGQSYITAEARRISKERLAALTKKYDRGNGKDEG